MPKKRGAWCAVEHCEEPKDAESGDGLCNAHSYEWRNSKEFREAVADENIRFWMSMKCEKKAMRLVGTFRRCWVKRIEASNG